MRHIMRWLLISFCVGASFVVRTAAAQDVDTVFLHGLRSDPSQWGAAVGHLSPQLAIRPHQPALDWRTLFEVQADRLERNLGGQLAGELVVVGHSNGGIVAREWTKHRDIRGVITLGSPNQGAPLVDHSFEWLRFLDDIFVRVSNVNVVYARTVDHDVWWWLPAQWTQRFNTAFDIWNTANNGLSALRLDVSFPVMAQMRVASSYMRNLDSTSNLNREAAEVRDRAAIVNVATNFDHGGPFRAIFPNSYENWHVAINVTGIALEGLAGIVRISADFSDQAAFDLADQVSSVADWLLQCRSVSDPSPYALGRCYENDGIVPAWSQTYDHPRVSVILNTDGPSHTHEMAESDDQLYQALTTMTRVPLRADTPSPDPSGEPVPPADPPPSPPAPDGPPPAPPTTGRYKLSGGICSWDPNDSGPDQCNPLPPPGRFKFDGSGGCYWDPNDYPPDQCSPSPPPTGRYKIDGAGGCYWDPNDGGPHQCVP